MKDTSVTGSSDSDDLSAARRRIRAAEAGAYVVTGACAVVAGPVLFGFAPLLWTLYSLGLLVVFVRLGGVDKGLGPAVVAGLLTWLVSVPGTVATEDILLQQRGSTVKTEVLMEREERGSRGDSTWYYKLGGPDGEPLPGPELMSDEDAFDPGTTITVVADPEGEVAPRTPGQADPGGDLLGAGAALLAVLGTVAWTAWRARGEATKGGIVLFRKPQKPSGTGGTSVDPAHAEQRLREVLRARNLDRRGYIRVMPESYPGLTQQRAARIAWEEGLRTEGWQNRGYWRFAEQVVEEVAPGADS